MSPLKSGPLTTGWGTGVPPAPKVVHTPSVLPLTYGSSVSRGDLISVPKTLPSKSPIASGDGSTPQATNLESRTM